MKGFKQFDIVEDVSDHHYRKKGASASTFNASTDVYKNIMREWKILQRGLPDSIFVRSYETRIDLLRAAVIGAAGTAYHDTLFFFDIAFPSNYPTKPPNVFFRSYDLDLNPHLHPDGTVCMSLLNNWFGWPKERWNASQSTILQVLLSIQALILKDKPFLFGNEKFFLSSCRMMIYTQKKPPKNFEAIVANHYQRRAVVILSACEAYTNRRVQVGYYNDVVTAAVSSSSKAVYVSKTFKKNMVVLYPNLVAWFKYSGACLDASIQHLIVEKETPLPILTTLCGILKKILGFFGFMKKEKNN